LRSRRIQMRLWCGALIVPVALACAGCFYKLHLGKVDDLPVDLKGLQPIALLPIQDFPGFPESGATLAAPIQDLLAKKGWKLIPPSQTSPVLEDFDLGPQKLLADSSSLLKVNERLGARLFLVGTILEYHVEKSFIRSRDFPVWDVWSGAGYQYQSLPTYHQGTCRIMLRVSLLEPEKGSVIWRAEGAVSGPSSSIHELVNRLVEGLLATFPSRMSQP